ncbi:MAG: acylneuraminate cytidylyltransferase, partial [Nitrososphaerota archaeon]
MNNQIFVQARVNSTRLPSKVLKRILDKTILELLVERLRN